ncbi:MAG: hypothetical protein ACJ8R9_21280 [Steroidobacteraceae bacterium]
MFRACLAGHGHHRLGLCQSLDLVVAALAVGDGEAVARFPHIGGRA